MIRTLTFLVVLTILASACAPKAGTTIVHANAAGVSLTAADLPKGMQKCADSADYPAFLQTVKAKDPASYPDRQKEWDQAQKDGVVAGQVAFFAASPSDCTKIESGATPDASSATTKLALNLVLQFKNEPAAVKGYSSLTILGFNIATLKAGGTDIIDGTATGFGKNSILFNFPGPPAYYILLWQTINFYSVFATVNMDAASSKKVAAAMNSRIH